MTRDPALGLTITVHDEYFFRIALALPAAETQRILERVTAGGFGPSPDDATGWAWVVRERAAGRRGYPGGWYATDCSDTVSPTWVSVANRDEDLSGFGVGALPDGYGDDTAEVGLFAYLDRAYASPLDYTRLADTPTLDQRLLVARAFRGLLALGA